MVVLHEVLGRCKGSPSFCYSRFNSDHHYQQGLAQPAYQGNNWFTDPPLVNNLQWAQASQTQQYKNNQVAYAANGWPTYPNGAYDPERDNTTSPPISDWAPGDQTPAWNPIAGGKGWGQPSPFGSENPSASDVGLASSVPLGATPTLANGAIPPPSVTPIGVATSISGPEPSLHLGIIPGPEASASAQGSGQGSSQGEGQGQSQGQSEGQDQGQDQGGGQGVGQEAGQGGPAATTPMSSAPYSNSTAAAPPPPSYTPVPGLVQAGTNEYDEEDECDEL